MVRTNGKKIFDLVGADAVFTTCDYLKRYLTGFLTENGYVLVDANGTTLYTDARYIEAAEKTLRGTDVTVAEIDRFSRPTEILKNYKTVGIPLDVTVYPEYKKITELGVEIVDATPAFRNAMAIKNDWELANIQKACEIAEDGFLATLPEIKEGMTESEVAALLEYKMRTFGAQGVSFDTIVAFGAHAAVPHHETGDTKLRFGDEILIDFGCKVNGYCSDITRTFLFGDDKKHEEFKTAYGHVLSAHNLVKEKLCSGMTGAEGDGIARKYLTQAGYGKLFTHSLGHGIGLNVHEFPYVRASGTDVLTDGMVFSDEPGVYLAGEYGIRIEDTVTLENGKVKSFMSKTDRNLVIL
ncbi:MAG: aminopeptidase P family protein [Clostridia bacterium]|nr:aminopeptidase P family protein [Clostridia bacterium]